MAWAAALGAALQPLSAAAQSAGAWEMWNTNTGVVCIHALLMPNDRLLCIERPRERPYTLNPNTQGETAAEIDISLSNQPFHVNPIHKNAFCGGHSMLADGSLFVVGGDARALSAAGVDFLVDGRQGLRIYHPCSPAKIADQTCVMGSWDFQPDMTTQRWYPTVTTLADGRAIIVGGSTSNLDFDHVDGFNNPTYEYFPAKTTGTWPRKMDVLEWAYPHSLYPFVVQVPQGKSKASGKVLVFASNRTVVLDPETDDVDTTFIPDLPVGDHAPMTYPHSATLTILPMTFANDFAFTIQICGGSKLSDQGQAASAVCYRLRPNDADPRWERAADLATPRLMPDSVLLPTGDVLYINGASHGIAGGNGGQVQYAKDPIFTPDLMNPTTDQHTLLAANASVARLYHSTALLTASGHVLTAGSEFANYVDYQQGRAGCWGVPNGMNITDKAETGQNACTDPFSTNIERFTPPYLLNSNPATRPNVTSGSLDVTYNSVFWVTTAIPADGHDGTGATQGAVANVDHAVAIRYTTTTHGLNTDQRLVELEVVFRNATGVGLVAPQDAYIAPPGNYHVFLLNGANVPGHAGHATFHAGDRTTVEGLPTGRQRSHAPRSAPRDSLSRVLLGTSVTALTLMASALL
ncbi:hypothetical protein CXG81DRAFT_14921 [Caulochytrium protostelioides]|uniref:Galactose oxidase n=1 Tax=Caulochytrium protostelioides TaxID=1555241 RepID=A0A4P9X1W0_9FUNG|nr:hypothetical protein CXG81DRAFT_14921 [Caulochytrium protostelioides]|eukprot:RKO99155.1 hypothetical protein CXG81DRAFT_14921 [Caulochytrium protostelioides]